MSKRTKPIKCRSKKCKLPVSVVVNLKFEERLKIWWALKKAEGRTVLRETDCWRHFLHKYYSYVGWVIMGVLSNYLDKWFPLWMTIQVVSQHGKDEEDQAILVIVTSLMIKITNEWAVSAKDCGPLMTPSNGSLFGGQTTYPHEVSFMCDDGFILRGSQLRSCTSEGTWSGTAAQCEGNQSYFVGLTYPYILYW